MELEELYKDIILEHYKNPKNKGTMVNYDIIASGSNPLCGDEIEIYIKLDGTKLKEIKFSSKGCSISQASASILAQLIEGKEIANVILIIDALKSMMRGEAWNHNIDIGDMEVFQGVRNFPVRVKCASLSWIALENSLNNKSNL
jgi:nitrogen fixation NifU-like protein